LTRVALAQPSRQTTAAPSPSTMPGYREISVDPETIVDNEDAVDEAHGARAVLARQGCGRAVSVTAVALLVVVATFAWWSGAHHAHLGTQPAAEPMTAAEVVSKAHGELESPDKPKERSEPSESEAHKDPEVQGKPKAKSEPSSSPRACTQMPGVRLQNGQGAVDGSGKKADDANACAERCRQSPDCGQAVYSTGGQGCYLFKEPAKDLKEYEADGKKDGAGDVFSSAVCGSAVEMAVHAVDAKKQRVAAVQEEWSKAEKRAQDLLKKLQPADKFALLHGVDSSSGFAGYLNPAAGGGNPTAKPLTMNDGPQGFNPYTDPALAGTSTQFPSLLTVAASFNPDTSRQYAAAIVEEFVGKGSNVLLGPDLEVTRVASTGRSFESLSGEDPFLGSQLVQPFVQAVQSKGIIATIKHWLDNNQEIGRMTMNVEVGDRAQHEIYMPPFKAAMDAGAGAVMCSYNKIYGQHACENSKLLKKLLREDAGFRGFVMSDWGATHDAVKSATSGLDVEMPGSNGKFMQLPQLVGEGKIKQSTIDTMASHVLASMFQAGQFDDRYPGTVLNSVSRTDVTSDAHRNVARQAIIDGAVLLKNKGSTLPLATKGKKIAMIGQYCNTDIYITPGHVTAGNAGTPFMGQGSGYVPTKKTVTPMKGLQDLVKDAASITFSADASAGDGADVAVVCASACDVHEGWDRMNFSLPEANQLVSALREQSGDKKIVVVGVSPGAVTTEWMKNVDASLLLFMPGEQVGAAVAQMLTGAASPSGRLPITMPPDDWKPIGGYPAGKDHMFLSAQYPGTQPPPHKMYKWGDYLTANFTEGVLVGYRWWDAKDVNPAFPFGYGLTYTEFSFKDFQSDCSGDKIIVTLTIANTGDRDGDAVPQLYVGFPSLKPAVRQLRGFQKTHIPKGGEAPMVFIVTPEDASYYDEAEQKWTSSAEKNEKVTVSIGTSSRDLLWHKTLSCSSGKVVV